MSTGRGWEASGPCRKRDGEGRQGGRRVFRKNPCFLPRGPFFISYLGGILRFRLTPSWGCAGDRLHAHDPHQAKNPLGDDRMPLDSEPGGHPAVSIDRGSGELRVDQAHEHLGEEIQLPGAGNTNWSDRDPRDRIDTPRSARSTGPSKKPRRTGRAMPSRSGTGRRERERKGRWR